MANQEQERLRLQSELDSGKTSAQRNRLGQFSTPSRLAEDIVRAAVALLPAAEPLRFLDPAFGTGSFFSALLRVAPRDRITSAVGYEIDPAYRDAVRALWKGAALDLRIEDFTSAAPPPQAHERANLLVCNPPYVRHHHLPATEKARLADLALRVAGVRLSGLSGLYCYFLALAHNWIADGGVGAWLIPSEFMDVNYGRELKRYLLEHFRLVRIHRFDPADAQFEDADVSSAVVFIERKTPSSSDPVELSFGGTLSHPRVTRLVNRHELRPTVKWSALASNHNGGAERQYGATLSDLFEIRRGLATGANDFFILTPEAANRLRLPPEFLAPILPGPRYLSQDEVQADRDGYPLLERSLLLLNCHLSEDEARASYPSLWAYLQQGVRQGIHERYLCRTRTPWYVQERRPAAPIVCSYMGRQGTSNGGPFRFILNHSKATASNVYLMLYPRPTLAEAVRNSPDVLKRVWQTLRSIPIQTLINEGRVYGGGLHKIEPNELAHAPADSLLENIPGLTVRKHQQMLLFAEKRHSLDYGSEKERGQGPIGTERQKDG